MAEQTWMGAGRDGRRCASARLCGDREGEVISRGLFKHFYQFRDGFVQRVELRELKSQAKE